METCPYCGSNIEKIASDSFYCNVCDMKPHFTDVTDDAKRKVKNFKAVRLEDHLYKTTPELMLLQTYELIYLLRLIRKQRSEIYKKMSEFYKENSSQYSAIGDSYEFVSRKAFIVENILRYHRLDYIPERITDKFLEDYLKLCNNKNNFKQMTIQKLNN